MTRLYHPTSIPGLLPETPVTGTPLVLDAEGYVRLGDGVLSGGAEDWNIIRFLILANAEPMCFPFGTLISPNANRTFEIVQLTWLRQSPPPPPFGGELVITPAADPVTFDYILSDDTIWAAGQTDIEEDLYESAPGVTSTIPGSPNRGTIQRVYASLDGDDLDVKVMFGTDWYQQIPSIVGALPIDSNNHVKAPALEDYNLIGYICVEKGMTNLQDPSRAQFLDRPGLGVIK